MIAEFPDPIGRAAEDWVLRLASDPSAQADCTRWRVADPRHEAAFRIAMRAWELAGLGDVASDRRWREEAVALEQEATRAVIWRRRGAGLALAAALVAGVGLPVAMRRPTVDLSTRTGEVRGVRLVDGSRITVGARSNIAVAYASGSRQVRLKSGQAFFEVAHDRGRPFTVLAGDAVIRVTGTKFDVHMDGAAVRVSVLEGRVEVRRRRWISVPFVATEPERVLARGDTAELGEEARFTPATQTVVMPGLWRQGRFYYSDATLGEVLADASRYLPHPLRAGNSAVAAQRLTISFQVGRLDQLIGNLQQVLPVAAERQADGSILFVARD